MELARETPVIKYVLKNAKGAKTTNRTVHTVSFDEPSYGRCYALALCGERLKKERLGLAARG